MRSWPPLVDAATNAWTAINDVTTRPTPRAVAGVQHPAQTDTGPMHRLQAATHGIADTLTTARWPGHGPVHHTVEEIASNLHRVKQLLTNHEPDLPLHRPDVRADIAAAQMRLMHTVYLVAHATTSSLQLNGRRLHHETRSDRRPLPLATTGLPYAVGPTGRWVRRVGVCEAIAGRYVRQKHGGMAAALAGEAISTPEEPDRLQRALARWDIEAHRTLAADPSPHHLVLASRTQALIATTALLLLEARRHIEPGVGDDIDRATTAVRDTAGAWSHLASRWADLATPGNRPDPQLAQAVAQLRAAARDLTHDRDTQARTDLIDDRVDVAAVLDSLHQALVSAADLADLAREVAAHPDLVGPARPLSIRAHNECEQTREARPREGAEEDVIWVLPADVLNNRIVPLPRPVAAGLQYAASRAAESAIRAAGRTAVFETTGTTRTTRHADAGRPRREVQHTQHAPRATPRR